MIQTVPYIGHPATLPIVAISTEKQIRMRNGFDEASLRELAASIREVGIIEPIVVRRSSTQDDQYVVIAGERRLLAASLAELAEVPVVIRETTPQQTAIVQAIENLQRVDLNLADTAEGVATLVAEHKNAKTVAKLLGKSPAWVSKHASIAKLHPMTRALLDEELTADPEILLAMDKIRRLNVSAFERLGAELQMGTLTRAGVRRELDNLRAQIDDQDDQDDDEEEDDAGGDAKPADKTKYGKLELALEPARKLLAALRYAQEHKPSSRPGDELVDYVGDFIRKTWG